MRQELYTRIVIVDDFNESGTLEVFGPFEDYEAAKVFMAAFNNTDPQRYSNKAIYHYSTLENPTEVMLNLLQTGIQLQSCTGHENPNGQIIHDGPTCPVHEADMDSRQ